MLWKYCQEFVNILWLCKTWNQRRKLFVHLAVHWHADCSTLLTSSFYITAKCVCSVFWISILLYLISAFNFSIWLSIPSPICWLITVTYSIWGGVWQSFFEKPDTFFLTDCTHSYWVVAAFWSTLCTFWLLKTCTHMLVEPASYITKNIHIRFKQPGRGSSNRSCWST